MVAKHVRTVPRGAKRSTNRLRKGYILLFTLGVLAVISVLVLSMAVSLRLDAQLVSKEKSRLQDEYTGQAALQYTLGRLNVGLLAQNLWGSRPPDPVARKDVWLAGAGPFYVDIAGVRLMVEVEDAGIYPDANLLSEGEWTRLLLAQGAENQSEARVTAKSIVETRQRLTKAMGTLGFASMRELVNSQALPQYLSRGVNSPGRQGIAALLVVGSELKQLDINRSPMALFKVLADFNESQMDILQLARSRGPLSVLDGQKLLAGSAAKPMTAKSDLLRVKISAGDGADGDFNVVAFALMRMENNAYKITDQFVAEKY